MADPSDEKADEVIIPAWDRVSCVFLYLQKEMKRMDFLIRDMAVSSFPVLVRAQPDKKTRAI